MRRDTSLGILALIIVIGGLVWYSLGGPRTATAPGVTATSSLPAVGAYTDHGQYYDIAANYPTTTPMEGSANAAAIASMRSYVSSEIASFMQQGHFDTLTPTDVKMMGYDQGRKEKLQIVYLYSTSPAGTPRTVSYIFTEYTDTLGAHGNTFFRTFTFDTKTGQELSIGDLFTPGSDYLAKLSSLSRSYLAQNLGQFADTQMVDAGTRAVEKSFQNFFLDNGTLAILFAPYDVAPYAAGPQTVRIPVSELSGLFNPAYK